MAAAVAVRTRTTDNSGVALLGPRRLNGSVAQPPPAKRPRLEQLEKERALELRKKHVAYVCMCSSMHTCSQRAPRRMQLCSWQFSMRFAKVELVFAWRSGHLAT